MSAISKKISQKIKKAKNFFSKDKKVKKTNEVSPPIGELKIGGTSYKNYEDLIKSAESQMEKDESEIDNVTERFLNEIDNLINDYTKNIEDKKEIENFHKNISSRHTIAINELRDKLKGHKKYLDSLLKNDKDDEKNKKVFSDIIKDMSILDDEQVAFKYNNVVYFSAKLIKNFARIKYKAFDEQKKLVEAFRKEINSNIEKKRYYEERLQYYKDYGKLCYDDIEKAREFLNKHGPSENFEKYWEKEVHSKTKSNTIDAMRERTIANLKNEIEKTLVDQNNINNFKEKVFKKDGEIKEDLWDPRIHNPELKDKKIALKETAKKIRKLLRKEKTKLDNLNYYSNKISEYKEDGIIDNSTVKKLKKLLEEGPSEEFEIYWRKEVSKKISNSASDKQDNSGVKENAHKAFSEIEHIIQPILDKLERKSKPKTVKLKLKNGGLKIGNVIADDYRDLEEPCKKMIKLYKNREYKYVIEVTSALRTIRDIAENILDKDDSKELALELNISNKEITASFNALEKYSGVLEKIWNKDKNSKREQKLNKEMFSKILEKPSILKTNTNQKECASFKSADILVNFYSDYAKAKAQQRNAICKRIVLIKELMGLACEKGKIDKNKNTTKKYIIGNHRKKN